jgi:hypothetical protein
MMMATWLGTPPLLSSVRAVAIAANLPRQT